MPTPDPAPRVSPADALSAVVALAVEQEGVVSRRQAYAAGLSRAQLRARLASGRWARTGRQTVCVTTGPLSVEATRWVAVLETCPRAALDGVTALQAAGVTGLSDRTVHVIAPKSSTPRRSRGVRVHESRRFDEDSVLTQGVRRVRPATAAVHAALWAVSDRQAALFLVLPVQQRVVRVQDLLDQLASVRRHKRLRLLRQVLGDVADGASSINELDVGAGLRRRGLPAPSRQSVVRLPCGRVYLDLDWTAYGVAVELDGSQHDEAGARLRDALRDLAVAGTGRVVVRIPLLAWRLDEDAVLDGIEVLLRSRGWRPEAERRAA